MTFVEGLVEFPAGRPWFVKTGGVNPNTLSVQERNEIVRFDFHLLALRNKGHTLKDLAIRFEMTTSSVYTRSQKAMKLKRNRNFVLPKRFPEGEGEQKDIIIQNLKEEVRRLRRLIKRTYDTALKGPLF